MNCKKHSASRRAVWQHGLVAVAVSLLCTSDVMGDAAMQVMKAKNLSAATIEVIDPESGTSTGSGGDVRIATGDVILFRFAYTSVPDKVNRGIQSYLTEYLPPNTEVVGVRITDENGVTIKPRLPGLAIDGCVQGQCNDFDALPGSGGNTRYFGGGTLAQVHADTGIFFSTDSRTARTPNNTFISLSNGTLMSPAPSGLSQTVLDLLHHPGSPRAHNTWDWLQVQAFGVADNVGKVGNNSAANGNGPFRYASPVAGPQTYYLYEATQVSGAIQFNNVVGPWQRIYFPGSKVGTGGCLTNNNAGTANDVICSPTASDTYTRTVLDAGTTSLCGAAGNQSCKGFDVKPATPITGANAVRFAMGEARTGKPVYAEIALRVTGLPLDPNFGTGGDHLDCAESFGGDIAARGNYPSLNEGQNLPWHLYVGSPSCVFLKLFLDIQADRELADASEGVPIVYTLDVKNLRTQTEQNVVVLQAYTSSTATFVSSTPAPDFNLGDCSSRGYAGKSCIGWNLGTRAPSAEDQLVSRFTPGSGGGGSGVDAVMEANYSSTALPAPGFATRDVTMIRPVALPEASLAPTQDPTAVFVPTTGGTYALSGTLRNDSNTSTFQYDWLRPILPSGWSVSGNLTGSCPTAGTINVSCGSGSSPQCTIGKTLAAGESCSIAFTVQVPSGTSAGIHAIDLQLWGSQPGFGGAFETYFAEAAEVPVGAARTARPVVNCNSLGSTNSSVTGTSEANAAIDILFNLISRTSPPASADGSGIWSAQFQGFGSMYGGLEVRATATAPGKLVSEMSIPCTVAPRRECNDGLDNDGDGRTDFPSDTGCDEPADNDESSDVQCSDTADNDGDGGADWPADLGCYGPDDAIENNVLACADGLDNDGDGQADAADSDCQTSPTGASEATLAECQDRFDNDSANGRDFSADPLASSDPGCHSAFDDDEAPLGFSPGDARPRILVVFDTSGSMLWNTCTDVFTGGDGSGDFAGNDVSCADLPASCDGTPARTLCDNGNADDSRLFQVKSGMLNVFSSFGEVEFGLMRFKQRGTEFVPPTSNAGLAAGGWQGGGAAPCESFNGADLLVSFSPDNVEGLISWMDGSTNYRDGTIDPPATLDWELRGSGTTPIGGALVDAKNFIQNVHDADPRKSCRPYRVVLVTDGQETCGGDPVGAASALHSAGFPVEVIAFATGDASVKASLDAIAAAGAGDTSKQAIAASDEAALSAAFARIITETIRFEVCDGLDNDCDLVADEDFPDKGQTCGNGRSGVCQRTGVIDCTDDKLGTECVVDSGDSSQTTEVCNSQDDDCDGKVDEAPAGPCNCLAQELCNGVDDDCDGTTDEGPIAGVGAACGSDIGECNPGQVQCVDPDGNPSTINSRMECNMAAPARGPAADVCDGADNDCDTRTDEGPTPQCYTLGSGCTDGNGDGVFECLGTCRAGNRTCSGGTLGGCTGEQGPGTELCNGIDDDCDGQVDELWKPDVNGHALGEACSAGSGGCQRAGTYVCPATPGASALVCNAVAALPGAEACNSVDDDCDGLVDETKVEQPGKNPPDVIGAPVGNACGGTGNCTGGTLLCGDHDDNGSTAHQIYCANEQGGVPEVCNASDDDCDDRVDEFVAGVGVDCYPQGLAGCTPDGDGTFTCTGTCSPGTTACVAPDLRCSGHTGPAAQDLCDGRDEDCDGQVDEDATCANGDLCVAGSCAFPCGEGEFPCPFGFFCKRDLDVCNQSPCDYCVANPCVDKNCPDGFTCNPDSGECEDLCEGVSCRDGETCQYGRCLSCLTGLACGNCEVCVRSEQGIGACQPDKCCAAGCAADQACFDGTCADVKCEPECGSGQVCSAGKCIADRCIGVRCGVEQLCDPATGACIADRCERQSCGAGQACDPESGECIADPCSTSRCPAGFECVVQPGGEPSCLALEAVTEFEIYAAGGRGCATAAGGETGRWPSWLLLAGLVPLFRRRRRVRV
jgi:MYXO-CTERM domain-containing protein